MADRFFSFHPEDANSFMNYNTCLQSAAAAAAAGLQLQQPQTSATTAADYAQASMYFSSAAVDLNNNAICSNSGATVDELAAERSSMLSYFSNQQNYNKIAANALLKQTSSLGSQSYLPPASVASVLGQQQSQQMAPPQCQYASNTGNGSGCFNRNRYMPYSHSRACAAAAAAAASASSLGNQSSLSLNMQFQNFAPIYQSCASSLMPPAVSSGVGVSGGGLYGELDYSYSHSAASAAVVAAVTTAIANTNTNSVTNVGVGNSNSTSVNNAKASANSGASQFQANGSPPSSDAGQTVTLQINNLDYSMDESSLRNFLLNQLKPITPVVSLVFEGSSYAKVTVPNLNFAKQVVANLHRKKIGHKRMIVSYTRDSSLTEFNTLRCQVAGLLKDVPYYTLPMYKFRELFQSRFKTSISVLDLYKMQDICNINSDSNEEKFISLQPDLFNSLDSSPLMEGLQHSVPYCTVHFKREQHKGWAEQEIEPLPSVFMTISEIQQIIYPLLKSHPGDIPVASLLHCIEGELNIKIAKNESGVNLEHLVCCVHGIQIQTNSFGNKILEWQKPGSSMGKENGDGRFYAKNASTSDPLYQISREVVELVKMSPKSTMKFNRFIPAYHNHFGKQCRVADYGCTKLLELFEALSTVVQIMGDGENRQITLTHRTQVRRFTSDLLRILRASGNKSVLLSQLPIIFAQIQHRDFDITDYGVCDITDILDGLVNSNIVTVATLQNGKDILISIPQRKQTATEIENTSIFASEVVELFRNAPQYSILFQKFVRSYHYHFAYQCRLSDYGFFKLADLIEAIQGVVEMEQSNDEGKKVFLSAKVARRVFAEQLEELIREFTGSSKTCMKLDEVLELHKKKFGYNIQPQALGVTDIHEGVNLLPYIEVMKNDNTTWIICHNDDAVFRTQCYRSCAVIQENGKDQVPMSDFISSFSLKYRERLPENSIAAMKHAVEIIIEDDTKFVKVSNFMKFLMEVVQFIEHRTILLSEIKSALNVDYNHCFQYGFPNLYTIIRAYPDIFSINMGTTQERCEISLIARSELALNLISRNGSAQQPIAQKSSSKKVPSKIRPQRLPLTENNRSNAAPKSNGVSQKKLPSKMAPNFFQKPQQPVAVAVPIPVKPTQQLSTPVNRPDLTTPNLSWYNNTTTNSLNLSMSNTLNLTSTSSSNKENSLNNSGFNTSFNSSLNSLSDPNASIGSFNSSANPVGFTGLWDRRKATYCNSTANLNADPTANCLFDLSTNVRMHPVYEPPKPDTPPSDNMPFWIDPIWANSNGESSPKINSLNIKLPELKAFDFLPMVLSPYSLSKSENMKKEMFSFDSYDRQID